jgi:hypothetical protein
MVIRQLRPLFFFASLAVFGLPACAVDHDGGSGPVDIVGAGGGPGAMPGPSDRAAAEAFFEALPRAFCEFYARCGRLEASDVDACIEDLGPEIREDIVRDGQLCDGAIAFYIANRSELDACMTAERDSCRTDDLSEFCPVFDDDHFNPRTICDQGPEPGRPDAGMQAPSQRLSLDALMVGGWRTIEQAECDDQYRFDIAMFICPGQNVRAAGQATIGSRVTELLCGSYETRPATRQDCNDQFECFPELRLNVRSTVILGGQQDVDPNVTRQLYLGDRDHLLHPISCPDGSASFQVMERMAGPEVTEDMCFSAACPRSGQGGGGSGLGQCGTNCDCGHCWYCESGTCRYGGEGPSGCYRGCPW